MAKAGDQYQELVGTALRALYPAADVTVGEWIQGPDGRRDLDVSVRIVSGDTTRLILIECKDWKDKVGVPEIDKLESKRHDLKADLTMISSNSGYTRIALRKAERVGIPALSALIAGNGSIRFEANREIVAKRLSVDEWKLQVFGTDAELKKLPEPLSPGDLYYRASPVTNWLNIISHSALQEHQDAQQIDLTFAFKEETIFTVKAQPVLLTGLRVSMSCSKSWYSQILKQDVTAGFYDHAKKTIIIPDKQSFFFGVIDRDKWKETEEPQPPVEQPQQSALVSGSLSVEIVLLNPIAPIKGFGTPDLTDLISEQSCEVR